MAAKKKASKKKGLATRGGTALADIKEIEAQIRKEAESIDEALGAAYGNRIKVTQSKEFQLPDGTKRRDPLNVVILDFAAQYHYWEDKFDPENPEPPVCFAIAAAASRGGPAVRIENMKPSEKSPTPMNGDCRTCAMNQFGTDERGRGKACKNMRVLAVVQPNDDPNTPLMTLNVSPTALQRFDGYVRSLKAKDGRTPIAVVTEVDFDDGVDHPSLTFNAIGDNENLALHWTRREEARAMVEAEPDLSGRTGGGDAPRGKKKTARKTKKKTSRRAA